MTAARPHRKVLVLILFLNQRGMSLIEVTVSILILGVTVFPLIYVLRTGSVAAAEARDEIAALNLAREVVEEIKSIPDNQLGFAGGGTTNTVILETRASAADGFYSGFNIAISGGTGSGQVRRITGYDGAARRASVDSDWLVAPDATSFYLLYRDCPGHHVYAVNVDLSQEALKRVSVTVYYTVRNQEREVTLTTEKLMR